MRFVRRFFNAVVFAATLLLLSSISFADSASPPVQISFAFDYRVSPKVVALSRKVAAFLGQASGIETRLVDLPLARMHRFLRSEPNTCSLWVVRAPIFEPHYNWVRATTVPLELSEFRLLEASTAALEGSAMLPGGTFAEDWAISENLSHLAVPQRSQIIDMLKRKHLARWIDLTVIIDAVLADNPELEMKKVRTIGVGESWMVCSLSTSQEVIDALAAAWDQGVSEGTLNSFYKEQTVGKMFPIP